MEKPGIPAITVVLNIFGALSLIAAALCLGIGIVGQEMEPVPCGCAALAAGLIFLGAAKAVSLLAEIEWNSRKP